MAGSINAEYESKVNLWGKTKDGKWHLLCLKATQEDAEEVRSKMATSGFGASHIQLPNPNPPYAFEG